MKSKQEYLTAVRVSSPPPTKRRRRLLLSIIGIVFLLCAISSTTFVGYQMSVSQYRQDTSLANEGVQHLQQVETIFKGGSQHLFELNTIDSVQHEFGSAESDFTRLQANLQSVPGVSTHLPVYGGELQAAFTLVPAALNVAQAGVVGCTLLRTLITRFQNPLSSKGKGLTSADMLSIRQNALQVITKLSHALDLLSQVKPGDVQFSPRLSKMLGVVQMEIPTARQWLSVFEKLLPALPNLLGVGTPTSFLIEMLDSSELRPGGGFIGNYGIATLSGGRLLKANITDVDLLDHPFVTQGNTIPYPPAYSWFPLSHESWSLRDSNLSANFPTSAQYGEQNYHREGGKVPVQGVIALTPVLIQKALAITGPIYMPEYQETITPENIITQIHFHQLGAAGEGPDTIASPDGHSSLRKRFSELLAEHFLEHVHQLSSSALPKFLQVLLAGLRSKDLQLYFNASEVEAVLHLAHVDSTIESYDSDSLMVVDTNIAADKANTFIHYTLNDQVTIDTQGNAIHQTTLNYVWDIPGTDYGNPIYQDVVYIYVPPNAALTGQIGPVYEKGYEFGRERWGSYVKISYGQSKIIKLYWQVPHAAVKDQQGGWHYQYEVQRQAGVLWQMHVQMMLPLHEAITSVQGGLLRENAQQTHFTGTLNEDTNMSVFWKQM